MDPISHTLFGAAIAEFLGLDAITLIFCSTFLDFDDFFTGWKKLGPYKWADFLHYIPFCFLMIIPMLILRAPIFGFKNVLIGGFIGVVLHLIGDMLFDYDGLLIYPNKRILLIKARKDIKISYKNKVYTYLDNRAIILGIISLFLALIYRLLSFVTL
jgi:membrane-bound metal-dependent hydrolase YbcI (DUF457 family)